VWEGRSREAPPYPDFHRAIRSLHGALFPGTNIPGLCPVHTELGITSAGSRPKLRARCRQERQSICRQRPSGECIQEGGTCILFPLPPTLIAAIMSAFRQRPPNPNRKKPPFGLGRLPGSPGPFYARPVCDHLPGGKGAFEGAIGCGGVPSAGCSDAKTADRVGRAYDVSS
jgi:hypothetical protein